MIWLPAFYIDITPVTNAEYATFVAATGHRAPSHWRTGTPPAALHDHPVVNVTHRDASAYAAWAGKALPTVEPERTSFPLAELAEAFEEQQLSGTLYLPPSRKPKRDEELMRLTFDPLHLNPITYPSEG